MRLTNKNTQIQLGNEVIINPVLELYRDSDSYPDKTRDITFRLLKHDIDRNEVVHQFFKRAKLVEEINLKQFYGHHNNTDTSSNVTSTYTDGDTNDNGDLVQKNLVQYLMTGGDITEVTITNYGYADYVGVQQYFIKTGGLISFNEELPAPLLELAKEVILNNLIIEGQTAKDLGFYFD